MLSPFEVAWDVLKGDAFHPSVTGFRTAARRGFSQPPMKDEATFAERDDHAYRMDRPSPERERYFPVDEAGEPRRDEDLEGDLRGVYLSDKYRAYEQIERNKRNRINMEMAQRAMEAEERDKMMNSPDMRDALERLGF